MRRAAVMLAIAAAALASGCASVRISHEGGRTVADIVNTGWYLFNVIPIASGNPNDPNGCSCRLFRRTVTLENNMKLLDYAMRKEGANGFGDLVSYTTDESVLFFFFKRHACHSSAELLKQAANQTSSTEPYQCVSPIPSKD